MAAALHDGFTQATDLAEHIVIVAGVDYRTAYLVVGQAVRTASAAGLRGIDVTGEMLDQAAVEIGVPPLGLAGRDLTVALDPAMIVATRSARGGAAPAAVESMVASCRARAADLRAAVERRRYAFDEAEGALLALARDEAKGVEG
jgi:argininosuccinate lyase